MTLIELFIIIFTLIGIVVGVVIAFNYGLAGAALGAISGGVLGYVFGGLGAILTIFVAHLVIKLQGKVGSLDDETLNESPPDHIRTLPEKGKLKDNLKEDFRGDLKGDDSTIANLFGGIVILILILICFAAPWWVHFRYSPWFGIGGAVFISFINVFFPVLNVNKFLFGIMHLNALVVIAVSIFRLIG